MASEAKEAPKEGSSEPQQVGQVAGTSASGEANFTMGKGGKEGGSKLEILVRNAAPGKGKDLIINLDELTTLAALKKILQEQHSSKPAPSEQVLIHGGKVLKNEGVTVGEIVKKGTHGQPGPFSFHLVIKDKDAEIAAGKRPLNKLVESAGFRGNSGRTSGGSSAGPSFRAPAQRMEGTSAPSSQPQQQQGVRTPPNMTMMPSGAVAVPYMVVNPVVSAAYGAAFAAVNNGGNLSNAGGSNSQQGSSSTSIPFANTTWTLPGQAPQGSASSSTTPPPADSQQGNGGAGGNQPAFPPLVPAIAFFPLGVPMLVPATAPPHGFQVHPQLTPHMQNPGMNLFQAQMPMPPQTLHHQHAGPPVPHHPHAAGIQIPRRRRRRVVMYRVSIRGLLQLILMFTLLYAYTPKGRFTLFVGLFCVFYVAARPLRRMLTHLTTGGNLRQGQAAQPRGFIHEILALVLGFVTSVFPTWNVNVQDEAEFAAAQELVNREEREREGVRNQAQDPGHNPGRAENGHFHQD